MFFASDNGGPAHPGVMERVIAANEGHALPYGADPIMDEVREEIRTQFEAPQAEVYLVATGSAANVLALVPYTRPYQTIYCTPVAHITVDECGAPEFYTGGAKLTHVPGGDKMAPEALRATIEGTPEGDVHSVQRGPVSLTQVTERGGVYSVAEIEALSTVAKEHDLPVHLDGARFANALAATGARPAEMSWQAGVDVLCLGGTKNGCLGVEAVVFFDPAKAWEFELRRKRGGHLFSKHRYLSAQMAGYLSGGAWIDIAAKANENARYLETGLAARGVAFDHPVEANMIFARMPRATHARLRAAGALYGVEGSLEGPGDAMLPCRLVCDWSIGTDQIDAFLALI